MSHRIVFKLGGDVVRDHSLPALCADIVALAKGKDQVLLVHGGGPQATEMQRRLGQEIKIVAGRRITDDNALEVMKMVVAGQLNVDLCSALVAAGGRPVGLHGASSQAIVAQKRPPRVVAGGGDEPIDFENVGDVHGVNEELLKQLLVGGYIPVLACLGADSAGKVFNINADVVANQCAKHLQADRLVIVTSAPGVLREISDPSSRIPQLTVGGAEAAIADGSVQGGMIPKLSECMRVLREGSVKSIHIVGKLESGQVLQEMQTPGSVGTVLLP